MTEHIQDMPTVSPEQQNDAVPSAAWFAEQGRRFLGAQTLIHELGILPDTFRTYKETIVDDDDELAMCNMALDVVKLARSFNRFDKYGIDSDLYSLEIKRMACAKLGARAAASFARSSTGE